MMAICRECGMGMLSRLGEPRDYWGAAEDPEEALTDEYWTLAKRRVFERALSLLATDGKPGGLLDIGGGNGHFARCALDSGWDAYSMDVSEHAAGVAARQLGEHRSFTSLPQELEGKLDVVTLWCVIAHLPDPRRVVEDAMQLLRPGGKLLVTTPNFRFQAPYAALLAALGRPIDFRDHDHYLHFTPAALELVLARPTRRIYRVNVGVAEDCIAARRLAPVLVPMKRFWNLATNKLAEAGLPRYSSELQVVVVKGDSET